MQLEGELVAELLDQEEIPSKIGSVAAISDEQICVVRRDWHELTHFRLDILDVRDCRAIEYQRETSYSRILAGLICFVGAAALVFMLVANSENFFEKGAPLIIAVVALISIGVRFITSTHRHVIRFEMPGEVLVWRSPAIDFKSKAEAAHAVRDYARQRDILRPVDATGPTSS